MNWILTSCLIAAGCLGQEQSELPAERSSKSRSIESLAQSARDYYSAGDFQRAYTEAVELCQREPDQTGNQILKGEIAFAAGKMRESVAAFDRVIELQPKVEPQLWQRGLALYYAEEFESGVRQFEIHQTVNSQDVENAVWHLLCAARLSDVEQARKKLIPIRDDSRVPMSQVYEMFAGRLQPDHVMAAADQTSRHIPAGSDRHKLQLYYAHLYIGLYWEMLGQPEKSLAEIQAAIEINPLPPENFMGNVATVHAALRNK